MCPYPDRGASRLHLKSVEIIGFKSFARPTRLELPSGITALVGPNGSGKSNVVDAVRWCLGEQSMRDIRGQRAEDVIFAGTRRVMGFAEVELTFESAGGAEEPFSELSVARRAQRTGDTTYALNGERVRLRDLMSAVRSLGIDGNRYVVVNQGMADAWLVATPAERRQLLEHAAGLSSYRTRREEARQKLGATAQNMVLIETVLAELEPRLRILRRQARAVRDRAEAVSRLRSRLVHWYGSRWHESSLACAGLSREAAEAEQERRVAEEALQTLEDAAEAWLRDDRTRQGRLDAARAALHSAQRESDATRFHLDRMTGDRMKVEEDLAVTGERAHANELALTELQRQLIEADVSVAAAREECRRWEERVAALDASLTAATGELEAARESAARAVAQRDALERVLSRARDEMERAAEAVDRYAVEKGRLERRAQELTDSIAVLETELSGCVAEMSDAETALRTHATELEAAARDEHSEVQRLQRLERIRSRLRSEVGRLTREHEAAERALRELASHTTESILDRVRVPAGWERAVTVGLGSWQPESNAGGWTAEQVASFRRWRDSLSIEPDVATWAEEVVQSQLPWPNPLIAVVFVVDDADAGRLWERIRSERAHTIGSPPLRIVSRTGGIHAAPGASGPPSDDRGIHYLESKRLSQVVGRKLARARDRLSVISEAATHQAARAAEQAELARSARAERGSAEKRHESARRSLQERERILLHRRAEIDGMGRQRDRLTSEGAALAHRLEHLTIEVERLGEERSRADEDGSSWAARVAALTREVDARGRERQEAGGRHRAALSSRAQVEQSMADLRRSLERLRDEQRTCAEHRSSLEMRLERLDTELADARKRDADSSHTVQEIAVQVDALEQERRSAARPIDRDQETRSRLSTAVARHERARAQHRQRAEELAALRSEISGELGEDPDRLPVPLGDPPTDDEIRRLRLRAGQYADADESVLDEYAEIEGRYNHLRANLEDLTDATHELEAIMRAADEEMRGRFQHAFAAVNAEFSRMFDLMLKGGEASLEQVDADGSVGIRARLPGKRAQSSAAFSGGEKSLVASSLLFAVLRTSPTPFVILDEVDAALDESNVDRYLAALRHVAQDTQTVVVTHNRATMAAADVLYGVTMDDEGASRVLSLRLDQYEAAG